ncbi:hypothetical protein [Cupriavidus gilardii]|jgi:hypothetical protein|uniref:hypothetical protein n=1 Tax=Cupriavidus gilardii TaxID=82541 RepID=UPI001580392C|nr:hypothetical protein [Cupriavidus gilardii]MCT9072392.1 hypothetical protein [Cupriavidus gilardii]QKS64021.1 hypothetical protein FOB47_19545 [Cupriavidus gilardii]
MSRAPKIPGTGEAWHSGTLGEDEHYVAVAPRDLRDSVDQSLEMQAISIRLPTDLVEQYQAISRFRKMGYQPLMREALTRFATSEMKRILIEVSEQRDQLREEQRETAPKPRRKAA